MVVSKTLIEHEINTNTVTIGIRERKPSYDVTSS